MEHALEDDELLVNLSARLNPTPTLNLKPPSTLHPNSSAPHPSAPALDPLQPTKKRLNPKPEGLTSTLQNTDPEQTKNATPLH